MDEPERPATRIAASSGPSSRTHAMPSRFDHIHLGAETCAAGRRTGSSKPHRSEIRPGPGCPWPGRQCDRFRREISAEASASDAWPDPRRSSRQAPEQPNHVAQLFDEIQQAFSSCTTGRARSRRRAIGSAPSAASIRQAGEGLLQCHRDHGAARERSTPGSPQQQRPVPSSISTLDRSHETRGWAAWRMSSRWRLEARCARAQRASIHPSAPQPDRRPASSRPESGRVRFSVGFLSPVHEMYLSGFQVM